MNEIILKKRYPHSRSEDITDAFMRGYVKGKEQTMKECGNCKHHYHEDIDDGWVCVNPRSRFCADWTEYEDTCEEWEEKGADDE